jgi:hypothetical protein
LKIFYAPFYIKIYFLNYIISDLKFEPWAKSPSGMSEKFILDRLNERGVIDPNYIFQANILPVHKEFINNWLSNRIQSSIDDKFNLSDEDYKSLIHILDFFKKPNSNTYAFLFSGDKPATCRTYLIPENRIKYFEGSKPWVPLFTIEGFFPSKEIAENHLKTLNINNGSYIYNPFSFKLLKYTNSGLDSNIQNRILYVKMINNSYLPYDPIILAMAYKSLYIKDNQGNFHDLKISTIKYDTKSNSVVKINRNFDYCSIKNGEYKWKTHLNTEDTFNSTLERIPHLKLNNRTLANRRWFNHSSRGSSS